MKKIIVYIITLLVFSVQLLAQEDEPIAIAKKIFGKEAVPDIEKYVTGEYTGEPNGQHLSDYVKKRFILLEQTNTDAVVAMTVVDSLTNEGIDTYLFFTRDSTWKISAFRALAMTGMIELMVIEMEKLKPAEIKKLIKKAQKEEDPLFSSRAEFDYMLGNAKLTIALDDDIIKHFEDNKQEFERLKDLAWKEYTTQDEHKMHLLKHMEADYHKLFISEINYSGYEMTCNNCITFMIGGILDNAVGYMYVQDKKDLPAMNPSRIIMIREIGNGWYIYKTT